MNTSKTTSSFLLGLLAACSCGAASAGPSLSMQVGAWHYGDSVAFTDEAAHSVSARDAGNTDAGGAPVAPYVVQSAASGTVSGGVIKVSAATGFTTGPLAGSAGAFGQWSDVFYINAPDLANGTIVQFHYSFQIAGNLALSYDPVNGPAPYDNSMAYAQWSFSHSLGNTSVRTFNLSERKDVLANGARTVSSLVNGAAGSPYGRFDVSGVAAIGMPIYLYTGINVGTFVGDGRAVASGSGLADLGHSFYWGGLDSVSLADGSSVAYSVLSQSGTDYERSFAPAAAVPEPGTLALLCAAMGALLASARRARARARAR